MSAPDCPADPAAEARKLPKADRLLEAVRSAGWVDRVGHAVVMEAIRGELDRIRREVLAGAPCPPADRIEAKLLALLGDRAKGTLRRVVNATGVVIHTNLGRAPLSEATLQAMAEAARGYVSLEYDLDRGERGDRYHHAEGALRRLTGAEAAVAVNNNAAAVMLALAALCEGAQRPPLSPDTSGERQGEGAGRPEVIVSRGQLVEIGGGFRIPEVLRQSGARLVEVGTTNRTYLRDYEAAITPASRILLSVHRSNFKLSGFVHEPTLAELVELARRRGLRVVDDLGSGALLATEPFGLGAEPGVAERIAAGADVVCFSGDKLLGGPQAGILAGRAESIDRARRHPLMRALRLDKVALAGRGATLAHYERGEALREIPVWRAIAATPEALAARARAWLEALRDAVPGAQLRETQSAIGGGTLPEVTLPTTALALPSPDADALAASLRRGEPPVIARIEDGLVLLDPRTVLPGEDEALMRRVREAVGG